MAIIERADSKPLQSSTARRVKEPVKVLASLPTKPAFTEYTYNAHKAPEILQELFDRGRLKHDNGLVPKAGHMAGKTYCAFHNMNNHNTKDCVKLKDQLQEWINDGTLAVEPPLPQPKWQKEEKGTKAVNTIDFIPGPSPRATSVTQLSRFKEYTYDASRAGEIWEMLVQQGMQEALQFGSQPPVRFACTFHYSNSHTNAQCVGIKDQIQEWLNNGRLEFTERSSELSEAWVNAIEEVPVNTSQRATYGGCLPEDGMVRVPAAKLCIDCRIDCGIPITREEYQASVRAREQRAVQKALEKAKKASLARPFPERSPEDDHKRARHDRNQEDDHFGRRRGRRDSQPEEARARSTG